MIVALWTIALLPIVAIGSIALRRALLYMGVRSPHFLIVASVVGAIGVLLLGSRTVMPGVLAIPMTVAVLLAGGLFGGLLTYSEFRKPHHG